MHSAVQGSNREDREFMVSFYCSVRLEGNWEIHAGSWLNVESRTLARLGLGLKVICLVHSVSELTFIKIEIVTRNIMVSIQKLQTE